MQGIILIWNLTLCSILLTTNAHLFENFNGPLKQDGSKELLSEQSDSFNYKNIRKRSSKSCKNNIITNHDGTVDLDVRFPQAKINQVDEYLCTYQKIPLDKDESYIVKFTPKASMNSSHHMLVYGCTTPASQDKIWKCGMGAVCKNEGRANIFYAWARNAPPLTLPKGIGYRIGGNTGYNYLVMQMHFAHPTLPGERDCSGFTATITKQPQPYYAGIYLLGTNDITIPPHSELSTTDVGCMNDVSSTLHVFAFRTHAHNLGKVITGYRVRDGEYKMIGKGNPQWPHAFYPRLGGSIDLEPGDALMARCTYHSNKNKMTMAGMGGDDEMCNFYMMYYTSNPDVVSNSLDCWGYKLPNILFPKTANDLAPYPGYAGRDTEDAVASGELTPPPVPGEHHHHHSQGQELNKSQEESYDENEEQEAKNGTKAPVVTPVLSWPQMAALKNVGQIGGLAVDNAGHVHVFHRAYRKWGKNSFDMKNRFTQPDNPINADTVYVFDATDGVIDSQWGSGIFYMPHGITVDSNGNVWVTDVAMHQVMKFPLLGSKQPLLTLGEKMVPGNDHKHFCKPTDVAVERDGTFYISDGYCNGRVLKFSAEGRFLKTWGEMGSFTKVPSPPSVFLIAHSITLTNDDRNVCVADREQGRIQCFNTDGTFLRFIEHQEKMGPNVFAIEYSSKNGGLLYAVNGVPTPKVKSGGFTIAYESGDVIGEWKPSSTVDLNQPHDIAVSPDGQEIYVGQLSGRKLYKFKAQYEEIVSNGNGMVARSRVVGAVGKEIPIQSVPSKSHTRNALVPLIVVFVVTPFLVSIICFAFVQSRKKRLRKYKDFLSDTGEFDSYVDEQTMPIVGKTKLNLGNFFNKSHRNKGFERVSTTVLSDDDGSQSEDEIFTSTMQHR